MRLRTVSPNGPGWTRRRAGKGFVYLDVGGDRLAGESVERVRALVIPPAWQQVWICPYPSGHIQAVGTDDAGRRQYIYHPVWRQQRDAAKFDRVLAMAKSLPKVRVQVAAHLAGEGMGRERAMACAVRLIDLGYFRIGNDAYTDEHGSYGLTTLLRRHVHRNGDGLRFTFVGKSGIEHDIAVDDPDVCRVVEHLRRRRGGGDELLAFKEGTRWRDVNATGVNAYLEVLFGGEVTAKDFRTWHATVIAATALADNPSLGETKSARRKVIRQAIVEVSEYLGNTPAIARGSYVDPRVLDLYDDGTTIAAALQRAPKSPTLRQEHVERAVLRLLSKAPESKTRSGRSQGRA
ncbi:MAG: DNA topoisomerase IB [Propionibacteriales bacterium]|nr:DNA topoisomerase IB [Propionibacteriales bacterium]